MLGHDPAVANPDDPETKEYGICSQAGPGGQPFNPNHPLCQGTIKDRYRQDTDSLTFKYCLKSVVYSPS